MKRAVSLFVVAFFSTLLGCSKPITPHGWYTSKFYMESDHAQLSKQGQSLKLTFLPKEIAQARYQDAYPVDWSKSLSDVDLLSVQSLRISIYQSKGGWDFNVIEAEEHPEIVTEITSKSISFSLTAQHVANFTPDRTIWIELIINDEYQSRTPVTLEP